jgi:hypothetical protein
MVAEVVIATAMAAMETTTVAVAAMVTLIAAKKKIRIK